MADSWKVDDEVKVGSITDPFSGLANALKNQQTALLQSIKSDQEEKANKVLIGLRKKANKIDQARADREANRDALEQQDRKSASAILARVFDQNQNHALALAANKDTLNSTNNAAIRLFNSAVESNPELKKEQDRLKALGTKASAEEVNAFREKVFNTKTPQGTLRDVLNKTYTSYSLHKEDIPKVVAMSAKDNPISASTQLSLTKEAGLLFPSLKDETEKYNDIQEQHYVDTLNKANTVNQMRTRTIKAIPTTSTREYKGNSKKPPLNLNDPSLTSKFIKEYKEAAENAKKIHMLGFGEGSSVGLLGVDNNPEDVLSKANVVVNGKKTSALDYLERVYGFDPTTALNILYKAGAQAFNDPRVSSTSGFLNNPDTSTFEVALQRNIDSIAKQYEANRNSSPKVSYGRNAHIRATLAQNELSRIGKGIPTPVYTPDIRALKERNLLSRLNKLSDYLRSKSAKRQGSSTLTSKGAGKSVTRPSTISKTARDLVSSASNANQPISRSNTTNRDIPDTGMTAIVKRVLSNRGLGEGQNAVTPGIPDQVAAMLPKNPEARKQAISVIQALQNPEVDEQTKQSLRNDYLPNLLNYDKLKQEGALSHKKGSYTPVPRSKLFSKNPNLLQLVEGVNSDEAENSSLANATNTALASIGATAAIGAGASAPVLGGAIAEMLSTGSVASRASKILDATGGNKREAVKALGKVIKEGEQLLKKGGLGGDKTYDMKQKVEAAKRTLDYLSSSRKKDVLKKLLRRRETLQRKNETSPIGSSSNLEDILINQAKNRTTSSTKPRFKIRMKDGKPDFIEFLNK